MKAIKKNQDQYKQLKPLPDSLLSYFKNKFLLEKKKSFNEILDQNKKYISFWEDNQAVLIEPDKAWIFLKTCFPQLNFPIGNEIHKNASYQSATLRGENQIKASENKLGLFDNSISAYLHDSFAGRILVLKTDSENDFIKIIQSLLYQNRPKEIPASMGAVFIDGINNWQKVRDLKKNYLNNNPSHQWAPFFRDEILPFFHLYKDRIIILSNKYYSKVQSKVIGMDSQKWRESSIKIRLMHECTHFYTKQRYGIASNNLHDELIADYIGILMTSDKYHKNWMLLFMGLENYPKYRRGGRLQNYIQDLKIDSTDFKILTEYIYKCIKNIALFEQRLGAPLSSESIRIRVETLCEIGIEEMASPSGAEKLYSKYICLAQMNF